MEIQNEIRYRSVPHVVDRVSVRNYGIDLLRVVSMFYVITLHVLGKGGVLAAAPIESVQYRAVWMVEMWSYCAVNIFAIISGYVGYTATDKKYNYANYGVIWLQVVFYGVLVTVFSYFIDPELVTKRDLLKMFFPVTYDLYWYFTAYTGLFFLIPLINVTVRQCKEDYLKKLFILIILIFSVYDIALNRFELGRGYSFIWLCLLYLLGAIMKKCDLGKDCTLGKALFAICICCGISWIWKIYGREITVLQIKVTPKLFESYVAPTHLCAAILHVIVFSKIKMSNTMIKMVQFAAPGAFAVYLLNLQFVVWNHVMKDKFAVLAERSVPVIFVCVLSFSLLFVFMSVCVDYVRQRLFAILKIKVLVNCAVEKMKSILTYLSSLI